MSGTQILIITLHRKMKEMKNSSDIKRLNEKCNFMQLKNWLNSNREEVHLYLLGSSISSASDNSGRNLAIRSDCFLIDVDQVATAATNLTVICFPHVHVLFLRLALRRRLSPLTVLL